MVDLNTRCLLNCSASLNNVKESFSFHLHAYRSAHKFCNPVLPDSKLLSLEAPLLQFFLANDLKSDFEI